MVKIIMNKHLSNLLVLALNSSELDGHGCDVDLDLDMSGCCYFSKYPHSVLMLAMHDHAPNRVSIYYCDLNAFDMINAVDIDDPLVALDRLPFLFHGIYDYLFICVPIEVHQK